MRWVIVPDVVSAEVEADGERWILVDGVSLNSTEGASFFQATLMKIVATGKAGAWSVEDVGSWAIGAFMRVKAGGFSAFSFPFDRYEGVFAVEAATLLFCQSQTDWTVNMTTGNDHM